MDPIEDRGPQDADRSANRCVELRVDRSLPRGRRASPIWMWVAVLCLIAMVVWVVSVHKAMGRLEQRLVGPSPGTEAGTQPSEQAQQIRSFESRLARVLGASVESKLRTLERSVERGPLSAEELRLLESTATELRLLQSNPAALAAVASAGEAAEHPRFQPAGSAAENSNSELLQEIASLRNFYYAALVGLLLLALAALGLWLDVRRRYRIIEAPARHQLPVIKSYQEDRGR